MGNFVKRTLAFSLVNLFVFSLIMMLVSSFPVYGSLDDNLTNLVSASLYLDPETGTPGIKLQWSGLNSNKSIYRIYNDSLFCLIGKTTEDSFIDTSFEFGKTYQYVVVSDSGGLFDTRLNWSNKILASSGKFAVMEAQYIGDRLIESNVQHNGIADGRDGDAKVHSTLDLLIEYQDVSCSAYISCVLKSLNFLSPDPKQRVDLTKYDSVARLELQDPQLVFANTYVTHTPSGCDYSTLKDTVEMYGMLNHYKVIHLPEGYDFNSLDDKYKTDGAVYVYDSNIAIYAGDVDNGKIYSFHGDRRQMEDGVYVDYKWTSGYDFYSAIYCVIVPDS